MADSIARVSPAPDDAPTAEELRRVAEEVRLAFPRPLRAPQLVLIDVDPHHLHAFWTLEPAGVDVARRALGGADGEMVLRISEAADGPPAATFDVEVVGLQGQCYVDIWGEQRSYRAEIGLRGNDGGLTTLAPAASVQLPSIGTGTRKPAPAAVPQPPAGGPEGNDAADARKVAAPSPTHVLPEPVRHPFPLPPTEGGGYDPALQASGAQPAVAAVPPPPAAPVAAAKPMPAAHELPEPVRHPFPLPPTEGGVYDPLPLAPVQAQGLGGPPSAPDAAPPRPMPAAHELPEPVRHPFPLPPIEAGDYIPEGLIGGFVPADTQAPVEPEAASGPPPESPGESASHAAEVPTGAETAGASPPPDAADPADLLPLENVLTLSSFALGRESVEFEINAELHISGRVRPGMRLQLFGRPVALRPDGSFSISRPLPNGALLFSSLLISDSDSTT